MTVQRLRDSRTIRRTLQRGDRAGSPRLSLHVHHREDDAPAALAFVASRKVGTAVDRNRAKRLMREAARRLPWLTGQDVVLVARPACASAHLDDVVGDLDRLADQLHTVTAQERA